jgi:hypothetical protein
MKRQKLALFLFIDAFGWEVLQRNPFFLDNLTVERKSLETILGYSSACDPSIISGVMPDRHRMWSSFYYSPSTSPFRPLRLLRFLPESLFSRGRVRSILSRIVKRAYGFTGYFQLYNVPFRLLPLFDYAEKYSIWVPGGLRGTPTIFDDLTAAGVPYAVFTGDGDDSSRFGQLEESLRASPLSFVYAAFGALDALMHARGNAGPEVTELVRDFDRRIRQLLALAETLYDEVSWYVFTDHGMHTVERVCDLQAEAATLGLTYGRDYVAFYDSTMLRFWFLNETARQRLTGWLKNHPMGRILSEGELRRRGVFFADAMYGELIFLVHSGVLVIPGFMGARRIAGMHGYDPADPDSAAAISSNRKLPAELACIREIYGLMRQEAGLGPRIPAAEGGAGAAASREDA